MEFAAALDFLRSNHRAVLHTFRRDGTPQLSPVVAGVDDDDRVVVSTRETAMKVANLDRDPRATLVVLSDGFFGPWVRIDGTAEIVRLPDALDLLVDYYQRVAGEHDDWDDYRRAMQDERRVLLRISATGTGPHVSG